MTEIIDNILARNVVKQFILRFEYDKMDQNTIGKVLADISPQFDRVEKQLVNHIEVNLESGLPKVVSNNLDVFLCILESRGLTLTFSQHDKSISFESTRYRNKDTYADILDIFAISFCKYAQSFVCKRMGMRFINNFPCESISQVTKVFEPRLSSIVKGLISSDNVSRAIAMEEFTFPDYKMRSQFGVVNKYYPEPIRVYDALLDIDVYIDVSVDHESYSESAKKLNRIAYSHFIQCIKPSYLSKLK